MATVSAKARNWLTEPLPFKPQLAGILVPTLTAALLIRFLSSLPEHKKCSSMHFLTKSSRAASATGGSEAGVKMLPIKESRAESSEGV